jgi:hypothetical protein
VSLTNETIPPQQSAKTSPESNTSQVVDYYEQGGESFLEVWLIDPSWNKNYWKAHPDELTKKVLRFVDKPALLTPYIQHPHEYEHIIEDPTDVWGNVRKHNIIDEHYRVGHIVGVKPLPNSAYASIIKLTSPAFIEAAKQGKIPRFVSPAVYNLNMTGPIGEFTSFEPLHIAFVAEPAYGSKAQVLNQCHGQQDQCLRNLGVASEIIGMGPACIAKALSKLTAEQTFHSSLVKSNVSVASELSLKEDSATPPTATATIHYSDGTQSQPQQFATVSTENKESKAAVKKSAETQQKEQTKESNTAAIDNNNKKDVHPSPADKEKKKEPDIASALDELKTFVRDQISEAFKTYKEEREQESAKEAKRKLIESYVTLESTGGSKEEQDKRIAALMHIPDADLKDFLEQHYKIAGKSRNNAAKASKVSDFNRGMQQNTSNNVGTAAAALLLDPDTNERIDRVLSITRFVPNSRRVGIVPNTKQEEATF